MPLFRLSLGCLLLLALSCTKKEIKGPAGQQGPAGPNGADSLQKGPLQGKVLMYDTTGTPLADNSGATVTVDSLSIKATTATDGSFSLDSLNEGIFSLSVQKQGFGTMHYSNFTNTGTQPPSRTGTLPLAQQMSSNYDLKSFRIDTSNKPNLTFTAILAHPHPSVKASMLIYVSDSTGVGNGNNKFAGNYFWILSQPNDSTLVSVQNQLLLHIIAPQFAKADKLYITVALDNPVSLSYKDGHGNIITPGAAKSAPEVILNNSQHIY
jgi:hypothetical protein